MSDLISIRYMDINDAKQDKEILISLLEENLRLNYPSGYPCSEKANIYWLSLMDFIKDKTAILIGAYDNQALLRGFLWAYRKPENKQSIFITHLIVDKQVRNCKIGSQLIDELILLAKKKHVTEITLTATCQNENAIGFYKKCGFYPERVSLRKDIM